MTVSIIGVFGALLFGAPRAFGEFDSTISVAASPTAEAGSIPEFRLIAEARSLDRRRASGGPGGDARDGFHLGAVSLDAHSTMRRRIEFIAEHGAPSGWLEDVDDGARDRGPTPLRLAFFLDKQLGVAAAGAGLAFTPRFSIGATVEIPVTDFGYDLEGNHVTVGVTLTF